jgi:hypothetical protein
MKLTKYKNTYFNLILLKKCLFIKEKNYILHIFPSFER